MQHPFGLVRIYVDFQKRNAFWRVVDLGVSYLVSNMLSYIAFFRHEPVGQNLSSILSTACHRTI